MRKGLLLRERVCASLLAALLGASAAQAAIPCVEPPAGAGFPKVTLQQVAQGLREPVHIAVAPDGSGRLYVVEQAGVVRVVERGRVRPEPFLDIRGQVESGGEKGLLSIAFHPRYRDNGWFFVDYTAHDANGLHTRISRWRRGTAERADPKSETVLLRIGPPYSNHNGGQLAFGPDGYLYIGMGDGGAANDPQGHAQNPGSLLGKLLRIDVDRAEGARPYGVPPDNPFVTKKGFRPEIWALGLRNPWRFSFDTHNGALWLADVGQDQAEEIDLIRKGGNYGWNVLEGDICTPTVNPRCDPSGFEPPLHTYRHPQGFSITGGFVYRGTAIPGLCGAYLYADYVSKRLWALRESNGRVVASAELLRVPHAISSFGQDEERELYLADHRAGKILKMMPKP
ncbi:MAG TPA: PQQ-dependent sugar dehydrogenase [Acidiferrobacterales bacterium]|nr:PQQ-dependent sugar dehydrogenase [Acidiferrobacterales bacterium]